jgi:hypothetical protein
VYVRDCYQCSGVSERDDIRSADVLQLDVRVSDLERFTLIAVYRLHSALRSAFIDDIEDVLTGLGNRNIVLVGDMNLDILSQSAESDNYLSLLSSKGMLNLVNEPTRIKGNSSTCLDHVFVRFFKKGNLQFDFKANVFHYNLTDHSTVLFSIHFCNPITKDTEEYYSQIDLEKLTAELINVDWACVYEKNTVSDAFQCFIDVLELSIGKCKFDVRSNKSKQVHKLKPWTTDRLSFKLQKRKKIYKLLMKNPNNVKLKQYYTNFRNQLNLELKSSKESFFRDKFEGSINDAKSQWKIVNELIGENTKNTVIREVVGESCIIHEPKLIANEFNSHFLNAPRKLRGQIDQSNLAQHTVFDNVFNQRINLNSFFMQPILSEDVSSFISSLKNSKSPGFDKVSSAMIKKIAPSIIPILTYLYNFSLMTGEFPRCLKSAIVVPIFKRGDPTQPNCYRPISLLSVFSKILEKVVKKQLLSFLNKNKFFSNNQFGFREGMSTEDALLSFMESVYEPINNSKKVSALFIDITKAFDTIDHEILLHKLWLAGIRGLPLDWFSSYLTGREQRVNIGGVIGDPGKIEFGVPQGSVLGPILFLIYVNDLCNGCFNGKLVAFADDTAFVYTNHDLNSLYQSMSKDLFFLRLWFDKNFMILSEKTKFMLFSLRFDSKFNFPLKFHETKCLVPLVPDCDCLELQQVNNMKYLGLIIDYQLTWKNHISKLKKELYISLRKFYLLNQLCGSNKILVNVYHALVGSRISYGITCWGGTYSTTLYPIVIFQKRFIRLISKKTRFEHTWPLFVEMKILPLRHLYIFKVLKMFYIRSSAFSITRQPSYNLRRYQVVSVPKSNLNIHQIFYSSFAPRLFNIISYKIGDFTTQREFLKKLKKWLFEQEAVDKILKIVK